VSLACTGTGIGATRRLAIGEAYLLVRGSVEIVPVEIPEAEVEAEVERYRQAVAVASAQLREVRAQIPSSAPDEINAFIDTHLLMLEDPAIATRPIELIRQYRCGAEWALQVRRDELVRVFEDMDDPYLRTRQDDIDHVVGQVQRTLLAQHPEDEIDQPSLVGRVILAQDLTPSDTILMRNQGIVAFITEFGHPMSHTAILARSLGIPAVVGVHHVTQVLRHGELLVVDGERGVVLAELEAPVLEHFRRRIVEQQAAADALHQLADQPSRSRDGTRVYLLANIEMPEDAAVARDAGAEGVGLYRTEFLYLHRQTIPDEEEQFASYLDVVKELPGIPITIRTLDLGADKQMDGHSWQPPATCNPALGLRAVRLCLKEPQLIRPQLRAILRVSAYGRVRAMIPLLSNLREIHAIKTLIRQTQAELKAEGIRSAPHIPIGGMIEVPAAALCVASFARHLDFLSIGTNDLIQYTLAIDRTDDAVSYLFDPLHPAVLRLIKMTIDAAEHAGIPVSMCGEMAGDTRYTRLLLGLGLREFSMQPGALLEIKHIVREARIRDLRQRVEELWRHLDSANLEELVDELNDRG
jgi:phosphoenolpyruvate-protein phosphotransferase (PTS system enzyme I)